jgi:transglutaminase-like putative cysteine protease
MPSRTSGSLKRRRIQPPLAPDPRDWSLPASGTIGRAPGFACRAEASILEHSAARRVDAKDGGSFLASLDGQTSVTDGMTGSRRQEGSPMRIHIGFDIALTFPQATPMLMMLNVHPSWRDALIVPDILEVEPKVPLSAYIDAFGNQCTRVLAPPGLFRVSTDAVIEDSGLPDRVAPGAREVPIDALPSDTLVFLLGSRYCETDTLSQMAWDRFGNVKPGWERVQAIVDFVHNHVEFGYPHARSTRTAREAHDERRGVCRDFAHLAVALCRSMNMPARYATGYLGDIGVPRDPAPMDFSAWFEVYLEGGWYTFDARHNQPRIGRIVMAYGRDAADVALTNTFGAHALSKFEVRTDEMPQGAALPAKRVAA